MDRALAGAETLVSGEWRLPFVPALSLEPPLALSWLDEDRRLVVRTSAESPFRVRAGLAERLGLPAARIRVVRPAVAGGGLGRSDLAVEDACALVTLRTGRPAQLALSAGEALAVAPGRPAQRVRLRLGLTRGEIVGLEALLLVDLGMDGEAATEQLRASARQALGLYRVPSLRFTGVGVRTHRPPTSAPRGSDQALAFALECALDEAAAEAAQDPAALRRRNLRRPGDPGAQALAALGEPPGADDARPVAELLLQLAATRGPASKATSGVAVARRTDSSSDQSGAAVLRLLEDGSFALAAGPAAAGSAEERLYADTAATILEVPTRRVVCSAPDTDSAPYLSGDDAPGGSAAGRAVEQVATQLRDKIREAGAALLGVAVAEASVGAGRVASGDGRSASFAEIGAAALRVRRAARRHGGADAGQGAALPGRSRRRRRRGPRDRRRFRPEVAYGRGGRPVRRRAPGDRPGRGRARLRGRAGARRRRRRRGLRPAGAVLVAPAALHRQPTCRRSPCPSCRAATRSRASTRRPTPRPPARAAVAAIANAVARAKRAAAADAAARPGARARGAARERGVSRHAAAPSSPWPRPASALRDVLAEGYTGAMLRADLLAGAVVGIVALPLSMALAIASGVPPKHGLYTAIVAGGVIALVRRLALPGLGSDGGVRGGALADRAPLRRGRPGARDADGGPDAVRDGCAAHGPADRVRALSRHHRLHGRDRGRDRHAPARGPARALRAGDARALRRARAGDRAGAADGAARRTSRSGS